MTEAPKTYTLQRWSPMTYWRRHGVLATDEYVRFEFPKRIDTVVVAKQPEPGTEADFAAFPMQITRDTAIKLLLSAFYEGWRYAFDIVCKERGSDGEWVAVDVSDLDYGEDGLLCLDEEYQTFAVWPHDNSEIMNPEIPENPFANQSENSDVV